jgi:hypothetical protein
MTRTTKHESFRRRQFGLTVFLEVVTISGCNTTNVDSGAYFSASQQEIEVGTSALVPMSAPHLNKAEVLQSIDVSEFYYTVLPNTSWDAPSIGCKNVPNGCRMGYTARDALGCLSWVEGGVSTSTLTFVPGVTRTECYFVYDTPSFSYSGKADKFRVAFTQSNEHTYAAFLTASGTSLVGMPNVVSTYMSPAVWDSHWNPANGTGSERIWYVEY